jgi:uncharacterized UPF0160 family protein
MDFLESVIGTHDGRFHCDDVIACTMLSYLLKDNNGKSQFKIIRTRDQATLDTFAFVVDVGHVYDFKNKRFDHHQENCNYVFSGSKKNMDKPGQPGTIPMSSAGMVYLQYGKLFIEQILFSNDNVKVKDDPDILNAIETIFDRFYYEFLIEIDAIDNGVNQFSKSLYSANIKQIYKNNSKISSIVARMNYKDPDNDAEQYIRFEQAMYYVLITMTTVIKSIAVSVLAMPVDRGCYAGSF